MNVIRIAPNYTLNLIPQQTALHNSSARFKVLIAGARSGKTFCAMVDLISRAYELLKAGKINPLYSSTQTSKYKQPALHLWVVSPTDKMTNVPLRYFMDVCGEIIIRANEHEKVFWLKGDILVEFKSAERPDTLVGTAIDGMLVDEFCRIRDERCWTESLRARLSDRQGFAIFSSTPRGYNWGYKHIYIPAKNNENGFELFQWTTADNPLIAPEEIELARATLPTQTLRAEYEASFVAYEGQIYDNFNIDLHTISDTAFRSAYHIQSDDALHLQFERICAGVDFGFTAPGSIVVMGKLLNSDNQYVVIDEAYYAGLPIISLDPHKPSWLSVAQKLKRQYRIQTFFCDSADPSAINDLLINGIPAQATKKGNGSVVDGIEVIKMLFHANKIKILTKCYNLLAEVPQYQWKKQNNIGEPEEPSKLTPTHALDAFRYVSTMLVNKAVIAQTSQLSYPIREKY